jgi:serine/threonine protein phosphatase PrpC
MREQQEDAYVFYPLPNNGIVFVVCDGMGGHRTGDLASKAAVTAFARSCSSLPIPFEPMDMLLAALHHANEAVAELNRPEAGDEVSGCTIVAGYQHENRLWFVSAGDSPLWIYRASRIYRINKDHSMRSKLSAQLLRGEISEKEFNEDKTKNVLLSALTGSEPELVDAPSIPRPLEDGDIIIAATDGILTLNAHEIAAICQANEHSMENLTKELIEAVRERGKNNQDNTTLAVLKCNVSNR